MRRREFITLAVVVAVWPLMTSAQKAPARIGFLGVGAADISAIFVEALKAGLRENGLEEGRDYVLDPALLRARSIWAAGQYSRSHVTVCLFGH